MAVAAFLMLAAGSTGVVSPGRVTLSSPDLRVGDVVRDAGMLAPATRAAIIARVPAGGDHVRLTRAALASLIRRRVTGIALVDDDLTGSVTFRYAASPSVRAPRRPPVDMTPPKPAIERGASLRLISLVGPVRIERQVTAAQSSRGAKLFVRDDDGQVFAARVRPLEAAQ